MAYASKLSEDRFSLVYDAINKRVSDSAEAQYQACLAKATTRQEREACAGGYPSEWSTLFDLWLRDKVTNLHVLECLRLGRVHGCDTAAG